MPNRAVSTRRVTRRTGTGRAAAVSAAVGRGSPCHTGLQETQAQEWSAPEPFGISEQVLLCCFGLDQSTERSGADLRTALVEVGFPGSAAREIVRNSPLTRRSAPGSCRLRRLGEERSVP